MFTLKSISLVFIASLSLTTATFAAAPTTMHALDKTLSAGVMQLAPPGERTSVNMYLVVGKDKALLIDTGNPNNISPQDVQTLTKLPLIVVNTHAHPDHSGSNNAFKQVYVHEADLQSAKRYSGADCELLPIKDGHIFDLGGGITLKVIHIPGHTPGSIALLDVQHRILFTGDTANDETWMHISNVPLETYKKSMEKLAALKTQYDQLLKGHGAPQTPAFIDALISMSDDILTGKYKPENPQTVRGIQGGASYKKDNINLRYNADNLREK